MKKYVGLVTFVFGVAVGSAATWYYAKKKYEKLAQEEIDSVKEVFSRNRASQEAAAEVAKDLENTVTKEKMDVVEYAKKLNREGYTNYADVKETTEYLDQKPLEIIHKSEEPSEETEIKAPYVIPPEEFDMFDDYDTISLTYYSDHILADENDEMVEDVEGAVGFDSLNHFGEYDDDSVYVRNERLKVDYEILLDQRKYTDVIKSKPYLIKELQ